MRLTADLINNSLSYLNPLKERELDLRGHKIPTIENLGVAGPQDAIDFTDNDIALLSNFPLSPRLNTLLCARNRIQGVDKRIAEQIPNLTTLVLTSNHVKELADLEGLSGCARLTHLSLLENPVTRKEHYRLYLIWAIPSLRFLDFQKVKDAEREQARELFGTVDNPTELAAKIKGVKTRTFDVASGGTNINGKPGGGGAAGKGVRTQLTETEKKRVQEMIKNAKSLAEITRIEKDLAEGRIPAGAADADRMVS
ncbi:U2 snRNP complex subunit [Exophiala dermatitidis]|uniref:U2 small nuclear ribonucleoprotein A' n=2 Tax=Exophiala dermatitidis TaxID=5970 RepID=H6BVL0_EXODN|nr:U2 small nuclear ribonucleoprotein A' [Exophiala dermatitidis NIH/UT8656]KAJ4508054.1 U2 snRNP complex subunit [Exophiala dermatitidis]EHY55069.1 U2 small nuclear ribonucleoprotein A' [Exophiala dermatitidis NIH/UT8656]KAJ4510841.1 U2 snRNP complex subunit [Exophiala dermatitidis]KAJ4513232.1 U2 snRNP complex subunit [Exophiala dermatitidis]KAJ4532014.1 U2 snRNP complex subunit [Exophiala dermatitidis]